MGMVIKEFVEHEIGLEEVRAGLDLLCMYGVKNFKDYTGEWVEVRCPQQLNLFGDEIVIEDVIPHLVEQGA